MAKSLSYTKTLSAAPQELYGEICSLQLQYFQSYDKSISELREGLKIKRDFYTKINVEKVPGKSVLSVMNPQEIVLKHVYGNNEIEARWQLEPAGCGTKLSYTETSTFDKKREQTNFSLVSFFYKFLFNRQMKKRYAYLQEQAGKRRNAGSLAEVSV